MSYCEPADGLCPRKEVSSWTDIRVALQLVSRILGPSVVEIPGVVVTSGSGFLNPCETS